MNNFDKQAKTIERFYDHETALTHLVNIAQSVGKTEALMNEQERILAAFRTCEGCDLFSDDKTLFANERLCCFCDENGLFECACGEIHKHEADCAEGIEPKLENEFIRT